MKADEVTWKNLTSEVICEMHEDELVKLIQKHFLRPVEFIDSTIDVMERMVKKMANKDESKNVDELKKIIKEEMVQIIKAKLLSSLEY